MEIILASASPRRKDLLRLLSVPFKVKVSLIDEIHKDGESPEDYVKRLSEDKAQSIAISSNPATLIIAADTIVVKDNEILEKPADVIEAYDMLSGLRGRIHQVFTSIQLVNLARDINENITVCSNVMMRDYEDEEISAYIASGDPFDKAGAYAIQHEGFHPVINFHGCFANVMGLPICHLASKLNLMGVNFHQDFPERCQKNLSYTCPVYSEISGG